MMRAWVEADDRGVEYLVRTGTGVVTAVVPVGIVDPYGVVPGSDHAFHRVEIYCDAPHGRPGAIRFSAHPIVNAGDRLFTFATEALHEVLPVVWTIQWHRHDWIPADLPIGSLNLVTDARCVLSSLDRIVVPELREDTIPDFVPVRWASSRLEGGAE